MTVTVPSSEKLFAAGQKLPASPQILVELGSMLLDVNSLLDAVARLLKRDPALAARILRISNSPAYGGSGRIGSIEEAVNRVGFGEVYRLTGIASVTQFASRPLTLYGAKASLVRDNTLFCALAMERLAAFGDSDPRAAYTAGLMRSAGKLVLTQYATDLSERPVVYATESGIPLSAWESSVLGINNGEASCRVLARWGFPAEIVMAVSNHYLADEFAGRDSLTHQLNIAAGLATRAGFGLPGESSYWTLSPDRLAVACLTEPQAMDCAAQTAEAFEALRGCFD